MEPFARWILEVQTYSSAESLVYDDDLMVYPIGSMYAVYGNIYHQYTPNVSIHIYIYIIHGSYGYVGTHG